MQKITFTVLCEFRNGMAIIQIKIHHELCSNKQHGRLNKYNPPCKLQKMKHGEYPKSNLTC